MYGHASLLSYPCFQVCRENRNDNWMALPQPITCQYLKFTFHCFSQRFQYLLQSILQRFKFWYPTTGFRCLVLVVIQYNNFFLLISRIVICSIVVIYLLISFGYKYGQNSDKRMYVFDQKSPVLFQEDQNHNANMIHNRFNCFQSCWYLIKVHLYLIYRQRDFTLNVLVSYCVKVA